jgi:hypothetical protein
MEEQKPGLSQFIFGDPDTGHASARKIIVYTFCVSALAIIIRSALMVETLDDCIALFKEVMVPMGIVLGFYFGKNGLPSQKKT